MTLTFPVLGDTLATPPASREIVERLARRRSTPAQTLVAPGPDGTALDDIIALAARSPDHGKLAPWRFVVLDAATRARVTEGLVSLAAGQPSPDKARASLVKLARPPITVMVVSTPVEGHKVPVWEQALSAGAVCMNLLHAAAALGWAGNWITDWYAYDPEAVAMFGVRPGERIAGFMHLGTAAEAPLERARPNVAALISRL